MLWSGDVLRNEDDNFSQWNCKTTTDVLDTYDKMVMNRKTYTVLYNDQPETEEMVVDSLSAGLKRILHTVMENGQIYDYPSNEHLLQKIIASQRVVHKEGPSDSDDDDDNVPKRRRIDTEDTYYLTESQLRDLIPYICDLRSTHYTLIHPPEGCPFYGNDCVVII